MNFGAKPVPAAEAQTGPVDTARLDALLPRRTITSLEDAVRLTLETAS